MFSKLLTRLDNQDSTLSQILAEVKKTNGRVTALETAKAVAIGKVAVISIMVSGALGGAVWLIGLILNHK
jgi:hypothetical protein